MMEFLIKEEETVTTLNQASTAYFSGVHIVSLASFVSRRQEADLSFPVLNVPRSNQVLVDYSSLPAPFASSER